MTRILLVDDEPSELRAWRRTLKYAGYHVSTASNAADALQLCDQEEFDLVILDYFMPSMRGVELLTRIRQKQPLVRSIIISGELDANIAEDQLTRELQEAVEADVYLHKPVSNQSLRDNIEKLLAKSKPSDWQDIATKIVAAKKPTIKKAKQTTERLDQIRKKKK